MPEIEWMEKTTKDGPNFWNFAYFFFQEGNYEVRLLKKIVKNGYSFTFN